MLYTHVKCFSAAATFKDVSFKTVKKLVMYLGLYKPSLSFSRREN